MNCKNCNWKWNIEIDDDNPYLCHKCGYDSKLGEFDMKSFEEWKEKNLPFTESVMEDGYHIRTFKQTVIDSELTWHRDKEDRIVESVGDTDWLFQMDNELPIKIEGKIFIPKNSYHRIIKGSGDLIVKVKKLN